MRKLILLFIILCLSVACNSQSSKHLSGKFIKMEVFKGDRLIINTSDVNVISEFVETINNSESEPLVTLVFEQGPDGRIVLYKDEADTIKLDLFTDTGNVMTEELYIKSGNDLIKILEREGLWPSLSGILKLGCWLSAYS